MKIVHLGPARQAVSGVSTHLNQLFNSDLAERFDLVHYQVGSIIMETEERINTGPIFVVGMNGSGMTMLAESLGRHPHMTGVRSCNAESTGDHTLFTDALIQDLTPIRCAQSAGM